jgi:hypothetical protein
MPDITVSPPGLGLEAYFTFKEPVLTHIRNKLNTNEDSVQLKVIGINNLKSMIESELRDPYTDTYAALGISNQDFRRDVLNNIPLYLFAYYPTPTRTVYIKCPLNYIQDHSLVSDILYTNRVIIIDMNKLPKAQDTTFLFDELSDLVYDRLGMRPQLKEVSLGDAESVTREEFQIRESIRTQSATVRKSNRTMLAEITLKHNQLLARLNTLNITLG